MIPGRAEKPNSLVSLHLWTLGDFSQLRAPTDFKEGKGHGRNPQGARGRGPGTKLQLGHLKGGIVSLLSSDGFN